MHRGCSLGNTRGKTLPPGALRLSGGSPGAVEAVDTRQLRTSGQTRANRLSKNRVADFLSRSERFSRRRCKFAVADQQHPVGAQLSQRLGMAGFAARLRSASFQCTSSGPIGRLSDHLPRSRCSTEFITSDRFSSDREQTAWGRNHLRSPRAREHTRGVDAVVAGRLIRSRVIQELNLLVSF